MEYNTTTWKTTTDTCQYFYYVSPIKKYIYIINIYILIAYYKFYYFNKSSSTFLQLLLVITHYISFKNGQHLVLYYLNRYSNIFNSFQDSQVGKYVYWLSSRFTTSITFLLITNNLPHYEKFCQIFVSIEFLLPLPILRRSPFSTSWRSASELVN